MIAGQALDMAFETLPTVDVAGCLAIEGGKTGALLGSAAAIGAGLAGAPAEVVAALDRFGFELGLAFQAADDLLGIWGDPARTGKPAWSDLRSHKKTLPVAAALATGGADRGGARRAARGAVPQRRAGRPGGRARRKGGWPGDQHGRSPSPAR